MPSCLLKSVLLLIIHQYFRHFLIKPKTTQCSHMPMLDFFFLGVKAQHVFVVEPACKSRCQSFDWRLRELISPLSDSYYSDMDDLLKIKLHRSNTQTHPCCSLLSLARRLWRPCSPAAALGSGGKAGGSLRRTWRHICMRCHSRELWPEPSTITGMSSGGGGITHTLNNG